MVRRNGPAARVTHTVFPSGPRGGITGTKLGEGDGVAAALASAGYREAQS